MTRPSNDIFHRLPEEAFRKLILESTSIRQVFIKMGLCISGDQYKPFKRRVAELEIDLSHFKGDYTKNRFTRAIPLEKTFALDTYHSGNALSKKIRKHNLLSYRCVKCGLEETWQNESITLQIDHINGTNTDNRLENLRYLCPNCHSQTPTFAGRRHKIVKLCEECGQTCGRRAKRCIKCDRKDPSRWNGKVGQVRVNWPSPDVLVRLVWEQPLTKLAHKHDGTGNGLKRYCRKHLIVLPPKGYWQRRQHGYTHEQALVGQSKIRPVARRMSSEMIERVRQMVTEGYSFREIAKMIGFSHTTISRTLHKWSTMSGRTDDLSLTK